MKLLETEVTPEIVEHLRDVHYKREYIISQGYPKNFKFQKALHDFYDLEVKVIEYYHGNCKLIKKEDSPQKKGTRPDSLIKILENIHNKKVSEFVYNDNDLNYEYIRESINDVTIPLIQRCNNAIMGIGGTIAGTATYVASLITVQKTQDFSHLLWGTAGLMIGIGAPFYYWILKPVGDIQHAKESLPENIKKRKQAFVFLDDAAKDADTMFGAYNSLTNIVDTISQLNKEYTYKK